MVDSFGGNFVCSAQLMDCPSCRKANLPWNNVWCNEVESRAGSSALGSCKAIDVATKSYLSDNDTLGTFLTDCTLKEPCTETSSKDLYECYTNWCHLNGETYRIPQKLFSYRLEERGYLKKQKASGYLYQCLSIKPEASSDF